jgi:lysophospholipase L1-like esterase
VFNTYDINIYASRNFVTDVRTADFTANGSTTISHDAASNVDDFDTLLGISPDGNNEITIEMSLGTGNTNADNFGYIGVMEITEYTPSNPGPPAISSISVNPAYTSAVITWDIDECVDATVSYGTTPTYGSSVSTSDCVETQSVELTGLSPGTTYNYSIALTDADNETTTTTNATFTTDATNISPIADAGTDQSITLPTSSLVLSGEGSSDPDDEIASYLWQEVTTTDAYIESPNSSTTRISDLLPGATTTFSLTVTDGNGNTDTDLVDITVNNSNSTTPPKTVVVLGSSTAAGTGPSLPAESWAAQFTDYLVGLNPANTVVNLAVGGYTTEDILPVAEGGVSGRNIEEAISLGADGIIINLPSNDTLNGITPLQSIDNYDRVIELAAANEIVVWIATTQPRNFIFVGNRENQVELKDLTISSYPHNHVDFWTRLAEGPSNAFIVPEYHSGDDIHLNSDGHEILYRRVVGSGFIESLYATAPTFLNIDVSVSNTGADISWDTDVIGSTLFQYGLTSSLGTSIPETNDHVRVTSHAVNLAGLDSCTKYYYQLGSNGAYFNNSTSAILSFTTTGCPEPAPKEDSGSENNNNDSSNDNSNIRNLVTSVRRLLPNSSETPVEETSNNEDGVEDDNSFEQIDNATEGLTYSIRGTVYESSNGEEIPISDASVSVYRFNEDTRQFELWDAPQYGQENPLTTDNKGLYSFSIPEGRYYLEITAPGYIDYQTEEFSADSGDMNTTKIELKPSEEFTGNNWSWQVLLLILLGVAIVGIVAWKRDLFQARSSK